MPLRLLVEKLYCITMKIQEKFMVKNKVGIKIINLYK